MLVTVITVLLASAVAAEGTPSRAEIDQRFAAQLDQLAAKCDELGLAEQAQQTRNWRVDRAGHANLFFLVPEADPLAVPADAPQLVQFWNQKMGQLRAAQAEALFEYAQQLLQSGQAADAYRTLHEVLRENPNQADARRILGYSEVAGRWRRPGVLTRTHQPRYEHPQFGWPAKTFWQIDTPHFQILTNHSAAEGLRLGERLEVVYSAWEQMFFSFWSNELQLAGYFDGGAPAPVRKKFQVVLFKSRSEYVSYLEQIEPRIGITLGIYLFQQQKVFLFHDESPQAHATWHHEVAHQLFQEYRSASENIGANHNAWAIEGVALYMESMRIHDGYVTLGGVDASRLQFARNRYLVGDFYVPLEELVALGRAELQQDERIGPIYSQSAGLAHFFLDGHQQRLREPLVQYLASIYHRRDRPHSLEQLTQTPLPQLDTAYQSFLQVHDADILALPEASPTTALALARTQVTDQALTRIGTFHKLDWLDLTATHVTSAGVAHLEQCRLLRDLSLASTAIDDAALRVIGRLLNLEELDLSATRITDQGLAELAKLENLKVLRLAVTTISDQGVGHLAGLKNLQMLDLRRSQVTPSGAARLEEQLPEVEIHLDSP